MTSPYERLASAEGAALLAAIAGFAEAQLPAAAAMARKLADGELAAAALATTFARRRAAAAGKFTRAREMFFTRDGYEQSSSEAVARHRGARFATRTRVADLCCGIGGDTIGIAAALAGNARVEAVDLDADALACARHNAAVYEVAAKIAVRQSDALRWPLRGYDAAFADPSRRRGSARVTRASEYQPPLAAVLARARELPGRSLAVKVAPGLRVSDAALQEASGAAIELEYVSERGECKEAVVWCGELARFHGARRATVIAADGTHTLDAAPVDDAPLTKLRRWLGEPDPAVIRSGLMAAMCERIGAAVLDRRIAYCSADQAAATPFVRWFEVLEALPFGVKRLRAWLRAARVGELIVKTRAFPLRPEQITMLLKPKGEARAVLVCTTIGGAKTAILCRAPERALPR
jgi:hypothetical protein